MNVEKAIERQKKTFVKIERRIKRAKEKNQKRVLIRMKKHLIKWLMDLKQYGIVVELNKGDGKGKITEKKLEKLDVDKLYKDYALDVIKETEKEVERQKKKNDGRKKDNI